MTGVFDQPADVVSRRNVRHGILRARNRRIAETRDSRWPVVVVMSPATWTEVALDGDPAEAQTVDPLERTVCGITVSLEPMPTGAFALRWPT